MEVIFKAYMHYMVHKGPSNAIKGKLHRASTDQPDKHPKHALVKSNGPRWVSVTY